MEKVEVNIELILSYNKLLIDLPESIKTFGAAVHCGLTADFTPYPHCIYYHASKSRYDATANYLELLLIWRKLR